MDMDGGRVAAGSHETYGLTKADLSTLLNAGLNVSEMGVARVDALAMINQHHIAITG